MGGDVIERARQAVTDAVGRLEAAGVADEALARFEPPTRVWGVFPRSARMVPLGRVWRLGVLLLGHDGMLYEGGASTRAVPPGRSNFQSVSGEQRRMHRDAAYRGRFSPGETVNFGATSVDLSMDALAAASGRLLLIDGALLVRWSTDAVGGIPFEAYLAERVALLVDPPAGA